MPPNNPYITKVLEHPDILTDSSDIYDHKGEWLEYFGNKNPLHLEIGTGMGNYFGKLACENPNTNYVGLEIRYKRLYSTAEKAKKGNNANFVVLKDFAQNIDQVFTAGEITDTYIHFPDPWANKERQRKHRLLQEDFLAKLYEITTTGGKVFFKTDHREYFDSTLEIIKTQGLWSIGTTSTNYEKEDFFDMKNLTEFEAHYRSSKLEICYMELEK